MARVIVNVNPQTLGHSGNNAWLQPKTTHSLYRSAPQRKSIRGLVVAAGIFGGLFGNSKGVKVLDASPCFWDKTADKETL